MDKGARAARMADQIRDYIAIWSHEEYSGYIFSITQVTLTPDKGKATVWVEVSDSSQQAAVFAMLRRNAGRFQHRLHKALGKQSGPVLEFELDDNLDLNLRFDELLKS
jgi:ribosome-binding factor A